MILEYTKKKMWICCWDIPHLLTFQRHQNSFPRDFPLVVIPIAYHWNSAIYFNTRLWDLDWEQANPHSIPWFIIIVHAQWPFLKTHRRANTPTTPNLTNEGSPPPLRQAAAHRRVSGVYFFTAYRKWCPSSLAKLVYKSHNYGLWQI